MIVITAVTLKTSSISSCIASWRDLEELVLSGNRLQYLPDNVANLRHLRVLRVHSNRLLTCPTFNKTASLKVTIKIQRSLEDNTKIIVEINIGREP